MKTTTIYVLAKKSIFWKNECDYIFDLIIESAKYYFNDSLFINGWVDLNTILSALGLPKEMDKVALGWKLDYSLDFKDFKDCGIDIEIVTKDDGEYIAFHNVVNLLGEACNDEN